MDFFKLSEEETDFLFTLEKLTEKVTLRYLLKLQKFQRKSVSPMHYYV